MRFRTPRYYYFRATISLFLSKMLHEGVITDEFTNLLKQIRSCVLLPVGAAGYLRVRFLLKGTADAG